MKNFSLIMVMMALVATVTCTQVKTCPNGKALGENEVKISSCAKSKCTLKRNTDVEIEMKLHPDRDFEKLDSNIQGIILDVPLPFPGYYGTSACPNIYDAEGKQQVGCPLKGGETYTYKNSFKVLPIYPTVSLTIHWGLGDQQGDAACFELPAKIVA